MMSIKCPDCESLSFRYTSDRSGNCRFYSCRGCGAEYMATWKGKEPIKSAMSEPKNTTPEHWAWSKMVPADNTKDFAPVLANQRQGEQA